jgi:CHASE2 domain-containing sensor protein
MLVNGGEQKRAFLTIWKVTASVLYKEALMILMILAPLIGVIGAALFSYGAWLVFHPAGFITAGVLCLFWSWAYQNICPRHVMFKTRR